MRSARPTTRPPRGICRTRSPAASAGPRTDALKQGLERARTLLGDAVGPSLDVTIDIGDAARGLPPGAALFVSARKPGERMPLLVARQPVDGATMTVRLDRTNAMQGDVTLSAGETLNVAARISASGALSVGADDPHATQEGVTLSAGVTPVRLKIGAEPAIAAAAAPAQQPAAAAMSRCTCSVALAPGVEATSTGARVRHRARSGRAADADRGARARSGRLAGTTRADRSRCDAADACVEHVRTRRGRCAPVAFRQSRCVNRATSRVRRTCSIRAVPIRWS